MPDILGAAANTVLGTGMGLLLEGHNDRRQLEQQRQLNQQQFDIDNKMAEANYNRQMRMWNETNYAAQVEQLKKAGLNPGLLYSKQGGGGTTAAATGAVSAGKAPTGGMEIINMMQMRAQQAEIELLKAQTNKTNAEAQNVPKTGENIEASTANLKADTANKGVQKEILETESYLKNIESYIAEETQNDAVAMVRTGLRKFTAEMHQAETQQKITAATAANNIKIVAADLAGILLQNKAIKASIGKTEEETKAIIQSVKNGIRALDLQKEQIDINKELQKFETEYGKTFGGILQNILGGLIKK